MTFASCERMFHARWASVGAGAVWQGLLLGSTGLAGLSGVGNGRATRLGSPSL